MTTRKTIRLNVSVTPKTEAILRRAAGHNLSAAVRMVAEFYDEHRPLFPDWLPADLRERLAKLGLEDVL